MNILQLSEERYFVNILYLMCPFLSSIHIFYIVCTVALIFTDGAEKILYVKKPSL